MRKQCTKRSLRFFECLGTRIVAYKLTVTNYNRQANFERDLLLCRCSSVHSIAHSSRSQYASYGGRHQISYICELHSRSLAVGRDVPVNAMLRLCACVMQSRDSENAQRNLEIVQTLRLCGTNTLTSKYTKINKQSLLAKRALLNMINCILSDLIHLLVPMGELSPITPTPPTPTLPMHTITQCEEMRAMRLCAESLNDENLNEDLEVIPIFGRERDRYVLALPNVTEW